MNRFTPDNFQQVQHEGMQRLHKEEYVLFSSLETAVEAFRDGNANGAAVDAALEALVAHMEEHFAAENRLMQEIAFPVHSAHAGEHEQALGQVHEAVAQWKSGRDIEILAQAMLGDHVAWLERHISTMDALTAQFAALRGT